MLNRLRLCLRKLADVKSVNYEGQRHIKRYVSPVQKQLTLRKKRLEPQPEPKRSGFLEWNRDAELYAFCKRLREDFDEEKLRVAFTHKSYVFSEEKRMQELGLGDSPSIPHNEELINRGAEITSKTVFAFLQDNFKDLPTDGQDAIHDYLLSTEVLAKAALQIGTKDIILTMEHPVEQETLSNTFLALVSALAESTDIKRAANFVKDFLITELAQKDLAELWCPANPMEYLNDILRERSRGEAEPRLITQTGRNTLIPVYQVGVYSDQEFLAAGFGDTVSEAKDVAALNAIYRMVGLSDNSRTMKFKKEVNLTV